VPCPLQPGFDALATRTQVLAGRHRELLSCPGAWIPLIPVHPILRVAHCGVFILVGGAGRFLEFFWRRPTGTNRLECAGGER